MLSFFRQRLMVDKGLGKEPIIYYVGMINSPAYCNHLNVSLYVGAAFKKMAGVINGLKHSGLNAQLLSLPVLDHLLSPFRARQCVLDDDGFLETFLPTFKNRFFRRIVGPLVFARFALTTITRHDVVLVYNHAPEYFLLLIILRLKGIAAFQDIEDVPISSDRSLEGLINSLFFNLTFLLTSNRKVVVSRQVAVSLRLTDYLVINGAFSPASCMVSDEIAKWNYLLDGGSLCIHYGGTLYPATGLNLFIQALQILDSQYAGSRNIRFFVTGIGDINRLSNFTHCLVNSRIQLDIHPKIPLSEYESILSQCHLSLSLRSPEAAISSTTFPSKVIEASSRGLALLTSDVSDVSEVYDQHSAFYLRNFDPYELSKLITFAANNPNAVYDISISGFKKTNKHFSPKAIGDSLQSFLFRSV